MNKKFSLVITILLVIAGAYLYATLPKDKLSTSDITPLQNESNVSVELSLKTSSQASQSAAIVIDLPQGSDHCAVLTKAFAEGKISGLDMRYDEKYQTNGVFVVNGIGKTDSPWWVYEINGSDAPAGCTQVKVNQGDKIVWEYLGG